MWQGNVREKEMSRIVIGKGLLVRGEFSGEGHLQVGGELEGRIDLTGTVVILEGSRVQADIAATQITVAGVVRGNLTAARKVELSATGQLAGDVRSKLVIIQDGAVVNGRIVTETSPSPPEELAEIVVLTRQGEASVP